MSRTEAETIVERGISFAMSLGERGFDLIALGEMGIGNTTAAAAVTAALLGRSPADVCGRGTGITDDLLLRKQQVIARALARPIDSADPFDVLSSVGGFELGFLAGVAIGAAARRIAVLLDGFPSSAAALIAARAMPNTADFLFASHLSTEPGHRFVLEALSLTPLLSLGMRLGEGTGALLAVPIIRAAALCLSEMATFQEAGVDDRE